MATILIAWGFIVGVLVWAWLSAAVDIPWDEIADEDLPDEDEDEE